MYYDDEGRRFNLLSGLLFGGLLGVGLALVVSPRRRSTRGRSARNRSRWSALAGRAVRSQLGSIVTGAVGRALRRPAK